MFISKERPIVIPQSEHQRVAGVLARHWGNEEFSLPPINRDAFELGVATHDRAFGELDTFAIGHITHEDRVKQVDTWLNTSHENTEAELVVLLHVRRLLKTPEYEHLFTKVDMQIKDILSKSTINITDYESADSITDFCDLIAFDFSFESATERTISVYKNNNENCDITYNINAGKITVDKWPFNVAKIEGYILGYKESSYPNNLQPVILGFEVTQE